MPMESSMNNHSSAVLGMARLRFKNTVPRQEQTLAVLLFPVTEPKNHLRNAAKLKAKGNKEAMYAQIQSRLGCCSGYDCGFGHDAV